MEEYSYADTEAGTNYSGWMYSVNNEFPGYSMDGYKLKNNDVIRVQFTLYGTGLDTSGSEQGKTIYTRADKSKLLEKLAYINQAPEEWLITQEDKDAYDRALEVAQTLNASQTSVNNALNALPETAVIWPQSVVLSSSSLSFYDNDTPEVLSAVIYPEESSFTKIVWSSSDPNVADVDSNGKVTPYKAGQTTITAIVQNGISDSCTVTVSPRPFTSISLDKMSLSMEAGNTYQLQVSGQPSNATEELQLEWSSSDTDVAVVSENGMVTAIGKETANITATKKDTDISSSCQVTVGEAKELAMEAKSLIESLPKAGELTLEDASAVIAAKDAYESLSDISKGYLENRTLLEQKLMRCVSAVQVLQDKYNNVQNVGFLISQIPSLSALSMDDRKTVEEASAAYDSLRTEEKLLVDRTSWSKLENAVSRMEQIVKEVQETNELFAAIPSEISLDDFEIIVAAADAYNALNDSQKQQLSQAVSDKLSTSLEALSELIEKAVRAVDISVTFSQDNTETAELIKAAQVYDNLKDNLDISEEIQEEIAQAKEWVGDGIHEQNGVQADSYWYIKTIAENTTDTSEALNAVKQKYANAQKIAGAWMIFYQDVRTGEYYQQEKNVTVTFSLSNLSNMENPMVFSYIDGNLKEYSTQLDLDKKSISIKSSSSGMFFIADVPIPLTGLDMKSSASVTKGSTLVLSPIRIPENATTSVNYIWKSSDNSIASVSSSGKVTGKKEGTATITVTAEGVKNAVASCKVTVVTKANTLTKSVEDVLKETKDYVLSIDKNPTVGSEWFVLALARNGMALNSDYFATYYNHLANYLEENDGKLTNTVKYTEYSKEILVMTSIGKDARNIAGYNLFENLADFDMITKQGFNGPIWALLALNCSPDYTIPKVSGVTNQTTEQKLIDYLVAGEIPGGGWALMGDEADTDITAMTLQALAPYYNKKGYEKVTAAIDRALDRLSEMQLSTGGFGTMGVETLESNAQVITALAALGIDPETDVRFIKNGKWTVENLISYHIDNSGFMHVKEGSANNGGGEAGKVNGMATEQGFYALVAYQRMLDGKTSLYDMSDLTTSVGGKGDGTGTGITDPKDQENPSDTNNPGSSTGTNGSGSNSSGNGNIGSGNSNAGNGSTGTNSDGSNSSGHSSTGTNSTGTSSTGNNNSGNASGKDTTYVASTGNGASSGKTTGKTASGSVGAAASSETKKSDENGETQETEEPWSFDGENYVANSSDTEIPDSVTSDEVEPETAGSQGLDGTAVNSIFASENIPYTLCILCGVAVVGVCIYFKRKKPGNTDGQQ